MDPRGELPRKAGAGQCNPPPELNQKDPMQNEPISSDPAPVGHEVLMTEVELLVTETWAFITSAEQKTRHGLELDDTDKRVIAALTLAQHQAKQLLRKALDE